MNVEELKKEIDKIIDSMVEDFAKFRAGRVGPELVENIKVEVYGSLMPLKSLASINVSDAKSLLVQPWDKTTIENITKALISSDMGFSASNEGDSIRVSVPDLTEERRQEFVKIVKDRAETARVAVRNARQKAIKSIPEGISEDEQKRMKEDIEDKVKEANNRIAEIRDKKEEDLMTI